MTRNSSPLARAFFGAGLALAALGAPATAQESRVWLNDASHCEIFRALNDVVPAGCVGPETGRTRGWSQTRRIRVHGQTPNTLPMPPAAARAEAYDANPPPAYAAAPASAPASAASPDAPASSPATEKSINARIQFEFDSFRLTAEAREALDRLAAVLQDELMASKVVQIEGHADATGPDGYNLTLSQQRARAVREYLVDRHSIPPERLLLVGKGEREPYDASHPTAGVNRRVVFSNLTG
jgi:outer membrane protein OmpA-like peptidoglycan-associated protein